MKFRSDIEGLRAVAILPVLAYHASAGLAPGGYVGVDIFFVISGYLISKIILDDLEKGTFSYITFYRRRIRRIFPALFFMLAVATALAFLLLPPEPLIEYGRTLRATVLFVSNMEFLRLSGYFAGATDFKPLVHTWSLAVEEQFYIFFPLLLVAIKRWFRGRYLIVLLACAGVSLLLSAWLTVRSPDAAFYFGPARAFELLIGSILALHVLPPLSSRAGREIVAAAGMVLILWCVATFGQTAPGPSALLPCLGAGAIIYAGITGPSTVGRLLSVPPMRFVGAISYSLYLWHWPLLSFARIYLFDEVTPVQTALAVFLAFVMAVVSWRFVERPFRTPLERRTIVFAPAVALMAGGLALSTVMILGVGLPQRFPQEARRLFQFSQDFNPRRTECHAEGRRIIPYTENCFYGDAAAPSVVAVWGDSHGAELSLALGEAVGNGRSVMQITSSACPPAMGFRSARRPQCAAHNRETLTRLIQDPRVHAVVLTAFYSAYVPVWPRFRDGFEEVVTRLTESGKRVIVVYPTPEFPFPVPETLGLLAARGVAADTYGESRAKFEEENASVVSELDSLTQKKGVLRVKTGEILCTEHDCPGGDGREVLYFDDQHLSVTGARKLAPAIVRLLGHREG